MNLVAALLVGAAVWLLGPPAARVSLRRLEPPATAAPPSRRRGTALVAVTAGLVAAGFIGAGWRGGCLVGAAVSVVGAGTLAWRQRLRDRRELAQMRQVAQVCSVLASLVRIGHVPATAIQLAARDCPILNPVVAAQAVGGDVPAALRAAATVPGQGGLLRLSQAWQVSAVTGAPLGPTLTTLAQAMRAERDLAQVVAGELASPRATSRLLLVLPIFGIAIGELIGARPLRWLTTGVAGPACLLAAAVLSAAGVLITDRIVGSVERAQRRDCS